MRDIAKEIEIELPRGQEIIFRFRADKTQTVLILDKGEKRVMLVRYYLPSILRQGHDVKWRIARHFTISRYHSVQWHAGVLKLEGLDPHHDSDIGRCVFHLTNVFKSGRVNSETSFGLIRQIERGVCYSFSRLARNSSKVQKYPVAINIPCSETSFLPTFRKALEETMSREMPLSDDCVKVGVIEDERED